MVNGLTAAVSGMQANSARFDRAAAQVARSGTEDAESPAAEDAGGLTDAMTEMVSARAGFTASLRAASTSSEMLLEAIHLGGYDS